MSNNENQFATILQENKNIPLHELIKTIFQKRDGIVIQMDISEKSCLSYGFTPGTRVNTNKGKGTVVGVFQENLWFQLDDEKGRVSYWGALRTYEDAKAKDITVIQEDYDIHYLTYYEFEALAHSECEKQYSSFDPNSNRSLVFPEPPFQFSSYLKEALARPFKSRRIVRSKNSTHLPILSNNDGNNNNNPDVLDIIAALPIELVREIAKLLTPLQLFIILFVSKVWYKRFSDPLIWEYYCIHYHTPFDKQIVRDHYNSNYIEYFFSYGIPKVHKFTLNNPADVLKFDNSSYKIGGLHWTFHYQSKAIYFQMDALSVKFGKFRNISVKIELNTTNDSGLSDTKKLSYIVNSFEERCLLFNYDDKCKYNFKMTVDISPALMSLLYFRNIEK